MYRVWCFCLFFCFIVNFFYGIINAQDDVYISRKDFVVGLSNALKGSVEEITTAQQDMYRDLSFLSLKDRQAIFYVIDRIGFVGNAKTKEFYPNRMITYAEVSVILHRFLISVKRLDPDVPYENRYFGSHWAASYFNPLVEQGVFEGGSRSVSTIKPGMKIKRNDAKLIFKTFLMVLSHNSEDAFLLDDQVLSILTNDDRTNTLLMKFEPDSQNLTLNDTLITTNSLDTSFCTRKMFLIMLSNRSNDSFFEITESHQNMYKDLTNLSSDEAQAIFYIIDKIGFIGNAKTKEFYPNRYITYAEASVILYRLLDVQKRFDSDVIVTTNYFGSHWSASYFNALVEKGLFLDGSRLIANITPNMTILNRDMDTILNVFSNIFYDGNDVGLSLEEDDLMMDDFSMDEMDDDSGDFSFDDDEGFQSFTKNIEGVAGTLYQQGTYRQKFGSLFRFKYNHDFSFIDFVSQFEFTYVSLSNRYEVQLYEKNGHEYIEYEFDHTDREFFFDLRELYIRKRFGSRHNLSLGRQLIVWGQFDIFSPIDFALPTQVDNGGFSLNKANNRMPQDALIYRFYPFPNVEFNTYYIPKTRISQFTKFLINTYSEYTFDSIPVLDPSSSSYAEDKFVEIPINGSFPDESPITAFRLMLYPRWFTLGLTYFDGLDIYPYDVGVVSVHNGSQYNSKLEGSYYNHDRQITILPSKLYGLELSKSIGNTTFKMELARKQTNRGIYGVRDMDFLSGFGESESEDDNMDFDKKLIYDWILYQNGGKNYIPYYWDFIGVGLDGNYNWGIVNFYVTRISFSEHSGYADIVNLENIVSGLRTYDNFPLFGLNIGKYFGQDKKKLLGFAGGMLTGSLGVTLYYGQEFRESWNMSVSLEVMNYISDVEYMEDKYAKSPLDPSMSFGLSRKF